MAYAIGRTVGCGKQNAAFEFKTREKKIKEKKMHFCSGEQLSITYFFLDKLSITLIRVFEVTKVWSRHILSLMTLYFLHLFRVCLGLLFEYLKVL